MTLKHTLSTAILGLRSHKSRSLLTILGIVIGIMSIMIVMALGQGANELILSEIQGIGSKTISIHPGRRPKGPTDFFELFTTSLKEKDVEAIKKASNVRGVSRVAPVVVLTDTAAYESETHRTNIIGASSVYTDILGLQPYEGEMFTDDDIRERANVVVIGYNVKDELFGDSDAIGKKIKIRDRSFRVVGILAKKGNVALVNFDDAAIIPYSTAQKYLLGINYYHTIVIEAETEALVPYTTEDITSTLREMHGITDPDKDDFYIDTMQDAVERVGIITSALTLLLSSVAAISLIVGGIGIMNIMLVSVTERTREIGLRKALGATNADVLTQFLFEAVLLTATGGVIGILMGTVISWIVALGFRIFAGIDWAFVFPIQGAIIGLVVAGSVGLVFGLYPARQAAKKSPIEALRYE